MADNTHERIFDKLEEIGEKLAVVCATCPAREKRLDAIDSRLRNVEAIQNKALGIVAVVSIIVGSIGAVITSFVKKVLSE